MTSIDITEALKRLAKNYPNPKPGLVFETPFQLLIATILAAQALDTKINQITPALFKKYPTPHDLGHAEISDLEQMIKASGFFHAKARSIKAAALKIDEEFGGAVPRLMEELLSLPGVARKTANVVLSYGFNRPVGIVVDTHVLRVCFRMGITINKTAEKVEADLLKVIPRKEWGRFPNRIKALGQQICTGRKAYHEKCFLCDICPKYHYEKG